MGYLDRKSLEKYFFKEIFLDGFNSSFREYNNIKLKECKTFGHEIYFTLEMKTNSI